MNLQKIRTYLETYARPIDLALYRYHFENGTVEDAITAIAKYQNDDGGFGNAFEPDMRLPFSTALATQQAFQSIKQVDVDPSHEVIQKVLQYLADTYDEDRIGWAIVRPEIDDYPHAPWWDYKSAMDHFSWANPNAELLGLMMKYSQNQFDHIVESMKKRAIEHIADVVPNDFHDAYNYKALYELADHALRAELEKPVKGLVKKAVTTDSSKWKEYVATPLKLVSSPEDEFAQLFDEALLQENLDFIEQKIVDGTHWEPDWDWAGNYSEVWEQAKMEWSGRLTVENLILLQNFGRL